MRENTLHRDNYNYYVGDKEYKTNFFLRFLSKSTKDLYIKQLNASSKLNYRAILLFLATFSVALKV